jgi:hypothetical protein
MVDEANGTVNPIDDTTRISLPASRIPHPASRVPHPVNPRPVIPAMRRMLYVASALVLAAGFSLYVLSEQTEDYFAWTIGNPLTAAFFGAAFWSSCALEFLSARERLWERARLAAPAVIIFTVLTLLVTLLHLDELHDTAIAWAWIVVYVIVPPVFLVILFRQLRAPGSDGPRRFLLPVWLRGLLVAQAALLLLVGAVMLVAPLDAVEWGLWPWPQTEIGGRAIGAWLIGLGIIAGHAAWENDELRIRGVAASALLLAILQALAIARYPDTFADDDPSGWVYLGVLASLAVVGVAGLLGAERAERQPAAEGATAV